MLNVKSLNIMLLKIANNGRRERENGFLKIEEIKMVKKIRFFCGSERVSKCRKKFGKDLFDQKFKNL